VDFPHVLEADVLVAMSQEAYLRFLPELRPGGWVVSDAPQVRPRPGAAQVHVPIAATDTALKALGARQAANVILLAAAVAVTEVVSRASLKAAVEEGVAERFRSLNCRALELGFSLGDAAVEALPGDGGRGRLPSWAAWR
jgi:2-oxoglutarate ferredoxin oxidoreductase subunit gamma